VSSWVRACALDDIDDGGARAVEVDGVEIAVVRSGDQVYAIHDECSHASVPLSEGDVEDGEIECWLHGSMFDLRTGKAVNLPATEPVPVYAVRIEGEDVLVDVTSPVPVT
jgi:3-phenylpropionate/trans-cinnamate dioxygenase ferredoxin component